MQQTKQFYLGKGIESLTVAKLQKRHADKGSGFCLAGEDRYNVGKVSYEVSQGSIRLRVTLDTGLTYVETVRLKASP